MANAENELIKTEASEGEKQLPVLEENEINEAVKIINKMVEKGFFKTAVDVGKYVLETFYNNDIELATSKDPTKQISYRKLLSNKNLNISVNHLNQMVRVAIQEDFINKNIDKKKKDLLTYSHRVQLLQIEDDNTKLELANKCIQDNLSVRDLRREIRGESKSSRSTDIVPFSPLLIDYLNQYSEDENVAEKFNELSFAKLDKIHSYIDTFITQVDETKNKLDVILQKLNPIYLLKKAEKEQPKEPKKRGRPPKK